MFSSFIFKSLIIFVCAKESQSTCIGSTCKECIQSGANCVWCYQKNYTESRCGTLRYIESSGCWKDFIQNPNYSFRILRSQQLMDGKKDQNQKAIQIKPQHISIASRLRDEKSFDITFRAANNYPVDLYFLFDNSQTMRHYSQDLVKLSAEIGQSIRNISSNFQMGYGVFQDKVIMPFTDTADARLENPCFNTKLQYCDKPFEFKHLLNLTNDVSMFKETVRQTNQTGNIDRPEGASDAILQAVSCGKKINWRDVGRKILIFASDGKVHFAGDGKLAGILTPNDGKCHLDLSGSYTMELKQDYPSVSQLVEAANEQEMHIIFIISHEEQTLFEEIKRRIPRSSVEFLGNSEKRDTKNIKQIIEQKYKTMSSEVKIVHDVAEGVEISIAATSLECETLGKNTCKGKKIQIGKEIEFKVKIKITDCPSTDKEQKITIYPDSHKSDKLQVDLKPLCDCECQHDESTWERNSEICTNGNGTLKCGLCDCHEGRYGHFCQCDSSELGQSDYTGCKNPRSDAREECSGAGICECGVCQCDLGRSGPYCECIEGACGKFEGEICGGNKRGQCVCNECECEEGYRGDMCEVITSNDTCIYQGLVCNGFGNCENGKCNCFQGYSGEFCQNCFLCGDDICESQQNCVQCYFDGEEDCEEDCPPAQLVDKLTESDSRDCSIKQADDCFVMFRMQSNSKNITLLILKQKECGSGPVPLLPIVAGAAGGVVLLGLLAIFLWKIITTCYDKIEYSRFEEDLKRCKWAQQDNPFYQGATTTYRNPMLDTSQPLDDVNKNSFKDE